MTSISALRRALIALAAATALGVSAQTAYPSRPIKLVVPFPPGGSVDTVARILVPQLQAQMGQPVVVENRPGANSVIGAQHVKQAAPDGYTLLFNASLQVVNPVMMTAVTYDPIKDFAPITQVGALPQLVIVGTSGPHKTLKGLLDDARKRPGEVQWAVSVYGAAGHLASELLKLEAKADMPIVPYKGGGPALNDLMGGHVAAMVEPMASAYPHVQAGRLRALAVTSTQRLASLPDLPTVAESGFPGFDVPSWYGVWAPAGTPKAVVDQLSAELAKAIQAPAVAARLAAMSFHSVASTPAEFARFNAAELAKYKALITEAKIRISE
jgi:tripartite-type tricarboxylate transporter receptor subunit TctC